MQSTTNTIVCAVCGNETPREAANSIASTGCVNQQIPVCTQCTRLKHAITGTRIALSPKPVTAAPATNECSSAATTQTTPPVMVAHLGTTPLRSRYNRKRFLG